MKDSIKATFPDNDVFILVRIILTNSPLSKRLVSDTQKVLNTRIFKHSRCRAKIDVLARILHFNVNDCPILF